MLTKPSKTVTFFADTSKNDGKITAADLRKSLNGGAYLKPGQGGLWSLTDTSKEYTSGQPYPP